MPRLPAATVLCLGALGAACSPSPRTATGREDAHGAATETTTSIKLDHFGYRPRDPKVAVFSADPGAVVEVRTAAGSTVLRIEGGERSISRRGRDAASGDDVWWVDLSALETPGTYHLFSPALSARSYEFVVAPDVYRAVARTAVRTYYLQRCGTAKLRAHTGDWADKAACHRGDATAGPAAGQVDRGRRDLLGGWHDAGDYNKYLWYAASNAILSLLGAWERDPRLFPDGGLDIPESGNGLSDVLDEVKWELDFFLKMQRPDGSVLSQLHADGPGNGASPPSADTTVRFYHDPTPESGAVFAGSCALAARVFSAAGQVVYARTLRKAALTTWAWLQDKGDLNEKAWAAAEIFRMDPSLASARLYVDNYRPAQWSGATVAVSQYDAHAAITYARAPQATPIVVSAMKAAIGRRVDDVFASDDLYRNGMPTDSYHWGSNSVRAAHGVFLLDAAQLGATGSHSAAECRRHALDFLHYFHGQNPLSMVYLTNMAAHGGEHSSWQIFHNWFGQSQSAHSRANHVGKPSSIREPHYPYFRGTDNHGVRDDKTSLFGPAPGFVPGGPYRGYSGDSTPPRGASYPNLFYRDWNDQTVWTARTWEITESSIGYQGPYVALVAAFLNVPEP